MTLWSGQLYDVWRYGRNQRMTQCMTQTFCPTGGVCVRGGTCNVLGFGHQIPDLLPIFFLEFSLRTPTNTLVFINTNSTTWWHRQSSSSVRSGERTRRIWLAADCFLMQMENYEIMGCMTQCLVIHFASYVIQGVWRNDLASCMTYDAMTGQAYDVWRYDWLRRMTVIRVWCMTSDALLFCDIIWFTARSFSRRRAVVSPSFHAF